MEKNVRVHGDEVVFDVVRTERIRMTQALRDFIRELTTATSYHPKILAIKFVRAEYGIGLKEAKDIVDTLTEVRSSYLGELLRAKLDRSAQS